MRPQRTIAQSAQLGGVGIHTGQSGTVTFLPAPENHGIVFVRSDLPGRPRVHVRPENAMYDPKAGRGVRVGVRTTKDGKRERISRATGDSLSKD